jgi:hypothetical protein
VRKIKRFCLFIGYPRSGSTISGQLLDIHPQMAIASQVNVFEYDNSIDMMIKLMAGWFYTDIKSLSNINVIGTKSGHKIIKHLLHNPDYTLEDFKQMIDMPLKILHVVRNPYDNLATWVIKDQIQWTKRGIEFDNDDQHMLKIRIDHYRELNDKIMELISKEDVLTYKLENLIKKPYKIMKRIYNHLEVPNNDYILTKASNMIYEKPNITRNNVYWYGNQIKHVAEMIDEFPYLNGYTFKRGYNG